MIGGCNVKHWSKTQTTIALSSGEAELNGIGQGIAQGLGIQSICRDLGFHYGLRVHTDATTAIGIARQRGMGKIRHLDGTDLWAQEVGIAKSLVTILEMLSITTSCLGRSNCWSLQHPFLCNIIKNTYIDMCHHRQTAMRKALRNLRTLPPWALLSKLRATQKIKGI